MNHSKLKFCRLFVSSVGMSLTLSGCLLTDAFKEELIDENKVSVLQKKIDSMEEQITLEELARKVEDFERLKPDLKSIVELKSELAYLTEALKSGNSVYGDAKSEPGMIPTIGQQYSKEELIDGSEISKPSVEISAAPNILPMLQPSNEPIQQDTVDAKFSSINSAGADQVNVSTVNNKFSSNLGDSNKQNLKASNGTNIGCVQAGNNDGQLSIHLASYLDAKNARAGWQTFGDKYAGLLCNLKPKLASVTVNGKQYLSLRVGPLDDKSIVRNLCTEIRSKGDYCASATYTGESL